MPLVAKLQDRVARLLGLDPARRASLLLAMLHRPRGDAAGYWLQLGIAATLATLGLALDSTAVVIGAMLIAPLMRPIVELAMGLATGSTPLLFGAGVRTVASVAVVVLASAALARALPFHEVTGELLARTAPTILDLFVAAACALAGAYAVVISSNDVTTTAAGTSIGISLVPPLCTAGYGVSIADQGMTRGAALLFTANVTGILVVATALFVCLGFGQVDIRSQEQTLDDDADIGTATRIGRLVSRRPTRLGVVARIVLPLALLGAVALPLVQAVKTMARRSSIRQHVATLVQQTGGVRVLQYALDQTARPMMLRVVVVGDPSEARTMEDRLRVELSALGEPRAAISVWAVPEASAVSALSARLDDVPAIVPPAPPPPPPPPPLASRVRAAWPAESGPLVSVWSVDGSPPTVRVIHLGAELGAAGRALLARVVTTDTPPEVEELALAPVERDPADPAGWLARVAGTLERAAELPEVSFCVTAPPPPRRRAREEPVEALARAVVARAADGHPNVTVTEAPAWTVVPQLGPCAAPPPDQRSR
ncbi:MAG TPA: DUF389 domain-containing protein [Kofleriaceae bacterium]|nr:DUF389 domain-containing protein [Kofleriaceae bacterium]